MVDIAVRTNFSCHYSHVVILRVITLIADVRKDSTACGIILQIACYK